MCCYLLMGIPRKKEYDLVNFSRSLFYFLFVSPWGNPINNSPKYIDILARANHDPDHESNSEMKTLLSWPVPSTFTE